VEEDSREKSYYITGDEDKWAEIVREEDRAFREELVEEDMLARFESFDNRNAFGDFSISP